MNVDVPVAPPPQTILIAMSPDDGTWSGERLGYVVDEVAAPARLRCVTRDRIPYVRRHLPALYFRDWSLQASRCPAAAAKKGGTGASLLA